MFSSGGGGMGGGFGGGNFGGGMSSFLSGLFGDSGGPYKDYMKRIEKYGKKGQDAMNPFAQAGQGAIAPFQQWLSQMKDPSQFINGLMGQYQESPFAKYQQQQGIRAGQNAASMGGLSNGMGGAGIGSTPFAQQLQQNAQDISSKDMNGWLENVLGINKQYGAGQSHLMDQGQSAANSLMQLFSGMGDRMGEGAFGKKFGQNQDMWSMISGLGSMFGGGLFG